MFERRPGLGTLVARRLPDQMSKIILPLFLQLELLMNENSLQTSNISYLLIKTSFPFFSSTTITEFLLTFSSKIILDNSFSRFF